MSHCSTESGLNIFLLPSRTKEGKNRRFKSFIENCIITFNIFNCIFIAEDMTFCENEESLIHKLRTKIHGVSRNSIMPSVLTERNWYI